jgi:tellurite methyltransferase
MRRPIASFEQDNEGDWIALLTCGHRQHVRHRPPFVIRTWVTSPLGRANMIGTLLNCRYCDHVSRPDDLVA